PHKPTIPPHNAAIPPHKTTIPPHKTTIPPHDTNFAPRDATFAAHEAAAPPAGPAYAQNTVADDLRGAPFGCTLSAAGAQALPNPNSTKSATLCMRKHHVQESQHRRHRYPRQIPGGEH